MTTLHPSDWADLVHRFEKDNVLFQKFYKSVNDVHLYPVLTINLHTHILRYMWKSHAPPCDDHCKVSTICDLLTSRTGDSSACEKILLPGMTMLDVYHHRNHDNDC